MPDVRASLKSMNEVNDISARWPELARCTDVRMALAVACAVLARCGGRTGGSKSH